MIHIDGPRSNLKTVFRQAAFFPPPRPIHNEYLELGRVYRGRGGGFFFAALGFGAGFGFGVIFTSLRLGGGLILGRA